MMRLWRRWAVPMTWRVTMRDFLVFRPGCKGHYVVRAETWIRAVQAMIAVTDTVARDWTAQRLSDYPERLQVRLRREALPV
jgi:hypothetical protein